MAARPIFRRISALLICVISTASCATTDSLDAANRAPVANAGEDATAAPGDVVSLDGSGSLDPDGDEIIYRWELSKPEGSSATLTSSNFVQTTFQPDLPGDYTATLIVSDGELDSPPDIVTVVVGGEGGNLAPVAVINGGPDLTASVGVEMVLSASSSSDPNGDTLAFDWSLDGRPDGSVADLIAAGGPDARFTPDVAGSYEISLVVSDGELQSAPVTAFVLASENANVPTASAGSSQTVDVGQTATLDGSASVGSNLTFSWSLVRAPLDSSATIANATNVTASLTPDVEGEYEARLVVSSAGVDSAPSSVVITARAVTMAGTPTAAAGSDTTGMTNSIVNVDGSSSSDPDSDPLSYAWAFQSRPNGSQASIDSPTSASAAFIPDLVGDYVLELTVSDGTNSDSDTVRVTVSGSQPAVEGDVIITEVFYDAGDENLEEWFELHNPTDIEWDLNGCVVEDLDFDSFTIMSEVRIAPGAYITLAKSSNPGFTPDYDYGTQFDLANSADEIVVTCGANEVANLIYTNAFAGGSLVSAQLKPNMFSETANDNESNWCSGTATFNGGTGTPGAAPDCN